MRSGENSARSIKVAEGIVGPVLAASRPTFRAVMTTVVPGAESLDEPAWREAERIIETAMAARPEQVRRQLATFLRVLRWLPVFRYGRRFDFLDSRRRAHVLSRLERSPILLLRRGFWGLRTLVFMGYYGRAAGMRETGYRASKDGWSAHRATGTEPK